MPTGGCSTSNAGGGTSTPGAVMRPGKPRASPAQVAGRYLSPTAGGPDLLRSCAAIAGAAPCGRGDETKNPRKPAERRSDEPGDPVRARTVEKDRHRRHSHVVFAIKLGDRSGQAVLGQCRRPGRDRKRRCPVRERERPAAAGGQVIDLLGLEAVDQRIAVAPAGGGDRYVVLVGAASEDLKST